MSFATITDFIARYGSVAASDETRVDALLADACAMVEDLTGETYTSATVPQAIIGVVATAVRRAYENPSGLTGETIGNYTWQGGRSGGAGVYFTAQEQKVIRRAAGKQGVVAHTLEGYLPVVDESQFMYASDGGDAILYYDVEDLET